MRFFKRSNKYDASTGPVTPVRTAALVGQTPSRSKLRTHRQLESSLNLSVPDYESGRYRIQLYRFLSRRIPLVSSAIWTWSRLVAAGGRYEATNTTESQSRLDSLANRLNMLSDRQPGGLTSFLTALTTALFRDGLFGGFVTVLPDGTGVDRFVAVDAESLELDVNSNPPQLRLLTEHTPVKLDRPDFYWLPFDPGADSPLGRSILQAVPFVAFIEQQLVDDMRRSSHNSGFHRLHIRITPPERQSGESDENYVNRINKYFDDTVGMIRSCDVDDNPVTWDNITIEHIGPSNTRAVVNSWFMHHRAMIEEICAGTNLAPFLMGYSYGATNTWSAFKFDLVMRQVQTVQATIAAFMEWLGKIDLALAGLEPECRFVFDNTFTYQASERAKIENARVENTLKLFESGLISKEEARDRFNH
jgi:hypothetical protein